MELKEVRGRDKFTPWDHHHQNQMVDQSVGAELDEMMGAEDQIPLIYHKEQS